MTWFKLRLTIEQDVLICAENYKDAVNCAMSKRDNGLSRVVGVSNFGEASEDEWQEEFEKSALICHADECNHAR